MLLVELAGLMEAGKLVVGLAAGCILVELGLMLVDKMELGYMSELELVLEPGHRILMDMLAMVLQQVRELVLVKDIQNQLNLEPEQVLELVLVQELGLELELEHHFGVECPLRLISSILQDRMYQLGRNH